MSSWLTSGSRRLRSKQRVGRPQYLVKGQDSRPAFNLSDQMVSSVSPSLHDNSDLSAAHYNSPAHPPNNGWGRRQRQAPYGDGGTYDSGRSGGNSDVNNLERFKLGGAGPDQPEQSRDVSREEVQNALMNRQFERQVRRFYFIFYFVIS